MFETIRKELGDAIELTNWPDTFTLGDGHQYDIERRSYEKAQALLKDRNCDLLISGRVKGKDGAGTVLSLRFTVAEGKEEARRATSSPRPSIFRLTLSAASARRFRRG